MLTRSLPILLDRVACQPMSTSQKLFLPWRQKARTQLTRYAVKRAASFIPRSAHNPRHHPELPRTGPDAHNGKDGSGHYSGRAPKSREPRLHHCRCHVPQSQVPSATQRTGIKGLGRRLRPAPVHPPLYWNSQPTSVKLRADPSVSCLIPPQRPAGFDQGWDLRGAGPGASESPEASAAAPRSLEALGRMEYGWLAPAKTSAGSRRAVVARRRGVPDGAGPLGGTNTDGAGTLNAPDGSAEASQKRASEVSAEISLLHGQAANDRLL
ncbi:hypothetical protein BD413DRAFT_312326 [Trametes elegans]|nr:hypothetical protein BD413DRAFT_312326 [Trametes elegans]